MLDYINLLNCPIGNNSYERVKYAAEQVRALSYTYTCPFITATQINSRNNQLEMSNNINLGTNTLSSNGRSKGVGFNRDGDLLIEPTSNDTYFQRNAASKPVVTIKNTNNGATSGTLKFINDKGAAGANSEVCGTITFYGDDAAQTNMEFARVEGIVANATDGQEGGQLKCQRNLD